MAARYELKKTSDNQYMFNLIAPNNEVILTSERYRTKGGAENGIASVRENSPIDARYERKVSVSEQNYFVLRAANYEVIGKSEMYSSKQAMENGIQSCKTHGPTAPVDDQT